MAHGREGGAERRVAHSVPARAAAVKVVSDEGVSQRREVDADLVRPARLRGRLQVGDSGVPAERRPSRDGRLASQPDAHLPAVLQVASERSAGLAPRRHRVPPDERAVRLLRRPPLERVREEPMRRGVPGEEDDPRGPLVEPVNEERARGRLRNAASGEEPSDDLLLRFPRPGGGRHRDAGGLVEGEDRAVVQEDAAGRLRPGRVPRPRHPGHGDEPGTRRIDASSLGTRSPEAAPGGAPCATRTRSRPAALAA